MTSTILKLLAILIIFVGGAFSGYLFHKRVVAGNGGNQAVQAAVTVENAALPASDTEVKKIEPAVATGITVMNAKDDKKKDTKKETKSSGGTTIGSIAELEQKFKDSLKEPTPCFKISPLVKYAEGIYYRGAFTLNAACSKDAKKYAWYFNGKKVGSNATLLVTAYPRTKPQDVSYFGNFKNGVAVEIKLTVTSSDDISKSTSSTLTLRDAPKPNVCYNQTGVKTFKLNKEYTFDATCSDSSSDENPITKYTWKFRDGGIDDPIVETGARVSHTFTKPVTNVGNGGESLEVELVVESKFGGMDTHYVYGIEDLIKN